MTRRRSFLLAAALTAALALAGCGGSDEASAPAEPAPPPATEPATTSGTTAATTEAETEPATTESETEPAETEPAETETEPAETETGPRVDVDVFIQVADGARVGGEGRIEAKKGDRVRIEIQVDAPQDVHSHGYELEKEARPNKPAIFRFKADLEGIFDLESHLNDVVLAKLVVEP
jgi:FtsP/CotA-like multicopper oxidase with cupredoxin domain